jgi:uncharacterized protein (DUF433 family)
VKATDFVEGKQKKMSGTPVVRGTPASIETFSDCLEDGEKLVQFLEQFSTVTREQGERRLGMHLASDGS